MKKFKKISLRGLTRIVVGLFFVVSGIAKLYPVESLEVLLVKSNISTWLISPLFARLLIAFEIVLGALIIFKLCIKNALYASFSTLVIFTIYLVYFIVLFGTGEDCECMGSLLEMKPQYSIIKNLVLLALIYYLLKKQTRIVWLSKKWRTKISVLVILIGISLPFILNPIEISDGESNYVITEGEKINADLAEVNFSEENVNLLEGRKLVCFFSMTCSACKLAAKKITVIQEKRDNELPIYIIFLENKNQEVALPKFLNETGVDNITYTVFNRKRFFATSDGILPFILQLDNGEIKKMSNYTDLYPEETDYFLMK